jgi:acetyl esterase/lipase
VHSIPFLSCSPSLRGVPRWRAQAALKYTSTGQLIASSEYLLALVKPQLAARIGRLLLWTPRDCRFNCRYEPHERNTLDVYGVRAEGASRPVLVFMHGGAWSFGHKWQYALVGECLGAQGFVVAVQDVPQWLGGRHGGGRRARRTDGRFASYRSRLSWC